MKIIRFVDADGQIAWGTPTQGGQAIPFVANPLQSLELSNRAVAVRRVLAPIIPPNIIAIGRNYAEHASEMKAEASSEEPLIFLKATTSVIGPEDAIVLPKSAPAEVDFEAELAVIIGKEARNVTPEEALDFVFGYCCANDVSARDCQKRRDKQWARGKSFDTFCPLGPEIITAVEVRPDRLKIRSQLNGRLMQSAETSSMIFAVPMLIAFISHQFTLWPGTVILTGTPAGVGSARTPPVFLRPGDEIVVEIDGVGRLSNRVVEAKA